MNDGLERLGHLALARLEVDLIKIPAPIGQSTRKQALLVKRRARRVYLPRPNKVFFDRLTGHLILIRKWALRHAIEFQLPT